jgi:hypothetical protein
MKVLAKKYLKNKEKLSWVHFKNFRFPSKGILAGSLYQTDKTNPTQKMRRSNYKPGCQTVYFQTKKSIWVHFRRPWDDKFGIYHSRLEFVSQFRYIVHTAILYFCARVDILFHILCCTKKNMATLITRSSRKQHFMTISYL